MSSVRNALGKVVERAGYEVRRRRTLEEAFPDLEPGFLKLYSKCEPYTMTSVERMYALYQSVRYVQARGVRGAVVECGVWRGGSSMLAALTLLETGDDPQRELWLYDTFEGMPEPTARDVAFDGAPGSRTWEASRAANHNKWCFSPRSEVEANLRSTGFSEARMRFVEGKVENTIPARTPERIALLRLDTDWYSSTLHELQYLYPRLEPGGVLLIDDYGHWSGAREAVDEYVEQHGLQLLLNRVDYTARIAVVPG